MAVYFVDMENVASNWGASLEQATKGDQFILFYTKSSPNISIGLMEKLVRKKVKLECILCCKGSNALDFQLATELGYRIHRNHKAEYVIVSKDTGYNAVVDYWKKRGITIKRTSPLDNAAQVVPADTVPPAAQDAEAAKRQSVRNLYEAMLKTAVPDSAVRLRIANLLIPCMLLPEKQRRSAVYKQICAEFGQQQGVSLYQAIRDIVKKIAKDGPLP